MVKHIILLAVNIQNFIIAVFFYILLVNDLILVEILCADEILLSTMK